MFGEDGKDVVDDGPLFDASSDLISGDPGDDMMDAFNRPAFADVTEHDTGQGFVYTDGTDFIAGDCERTVVGRYPDPTGREFGPFNPIR